jgi:hypothetical protein
MKKIKVILSIFLFTLIINQASAYFLELPEFNVMQTENKEKIESVSLPVCNGTDVGEICAVDKNYQNFKPEHIKKGVKINNITGNLSGEVFCDTANGVKWDKAKQKCIYSPYCQFDNSGSMFNDCKIK